MVWRRRRLRLDQSLAGQLGFRVPGETRVSDGGRGDVDEVLHAGASRFGHQMRGPQPVDAIECFAIGDRMTAARW